MGRSETDKKIGIFGGTFNPVHKGHINAAVKASSTLGLDSVIFIPVFIPPHKTAEDLAPWQDRMAMLELAVEKYFDFHVSDIEIKREGSSYSIDTLKELGNIYAGEFFFIMGTDSFASFKSWFKWNEILKATNLVVVSRPGYEADRVTLDQDGYYEEEKNQFTHKENKKIIFIEIDGIDISSTTLRKTWVDKDFSRKYLGEEIFQYIEKKRLYR